MRYLLIFCIILLCSCSREYLPPIGGIQFSINNPDKAELISKLDSFAFTNNLKKVSEGGEQMLPQKAAVLVAARYELDDSVHIIVQNYLDHACFFAAAYDYDKNNGKKALKVAKSLKLNLIKSFGDRLTLYNDSQCKSAI